MLVLERKVQEGFWIDQRIYVKVIAIGKRRVKLGIEAPPELHITRSELEPKAAEPAANGSRDETMQILPGRRRN
jgi:carbon storage regulator